jgi:dienelactone hydrolase
MHSAQKRRLFAVITISLTIFGLLATHAVNTDFGRVTVTAISTASEDRTLAGLLYQPISASADQPAPAVILAHGIAGSKEMMSSIGLELARRGFVALCLDLYGHGESEGTVRDGENEASFGVLSAVRRLRMQAVVNASAIGLVGHSLGAGAVRAAAVQDQQIGALVLIAGGVGNVAEDPAYGALNQTFPKNLLVIVGEYDVLFNLPDLTARELPPVFGAPAEVVPDIVYGSFLAQTARRLVVPATTHLFEPVDPAVVHETVVWMEQAFAGWQSPDADPSVDLIYLAREAAILTALAGLFGVVFSAYFVVAKRLPPRPRVESGPVAERRLKDWKAYAVWGALNLGLFLPMFGVGFIIPFPPLIFGASVAWWMLAVGVAGGGLWARTMRKSRQTSAELTTRIAKVFDRNTVLVALVLFALFFVVVSLLDGVFDVNLRIVAPIFRALTSARRIVAFLTFLPFFFVYFAVEGLYLHEHGAREPREHEARALLCSWGKAVFAKVAPFAALVALAYVPKILFGVWVLPSFVGFLMEFLWLILPVFILTTTCSWWFHRNTQNVAVGTVFNSLMMAWTAAAVFPF